MKILRHPSPFLVAAALILSACNQTSMPASSSANFASSGLQMPDGTGCKGEIDRYRAIMDNDLAMGHVNKSVHIRVAREIEQAMSACSAGRDAEAIRMINATKSRYGYA
jgi:hypothetical protein